MNDLDHILDANLGDRTTIQPGASGSERGLADVLRRGRQRRRRKLAGIVTGSCAAIALVVATIATTTGNDKTLVVSPDPSTTTTGPAPSTSPVTTGTTVTAPSSTVISTPSSTTAGPVTTVPATTAPLPTVTANNVASTTTTEVAPTSTAIATTTSPTAPIPAPLRTYVAVTDRGTVEVRSGDQVIGQASCANCSVSAATYRDGTIWMAHSSSDVAEVTRHDLATGAVTSVYRADPGVTIRDLAVWNSSVWIVTATDEPAYELVAVDANGVRSVEAGVLGVQASRDGRYLAYATCGYCLANFPPSPLDTAIIVSDLITGQQRRIPPAGVDSNGRRRSYLAPVPTDWTSSGMLLLHETWEGNIASVIAAFIASNQVDSVEYSQASQASNQPYVPAEAACFVDEQHVAVARWFHPYAEGEPAPGPIVVRGIINPGDETTYGSATVLGRSMACDIDGAVVVTTEDRRLVRITPDGTTTELGVSYAMVANS